MMIFWVQMLSFTIFLVNFVDVRDCASGFVGFNEN
jgi:hypothetical protein